MAEQNINNTPIERLHARDKMLDAFETRLGLPAYTEDFTQSPEIQEYLSFNRDVLEKLNPEECVEISIILKAFAFHLQRAKNRETARTNWAKAELRRLVTPKINQFRGGSFEQVFDMAALSDNYTVELMRIRDQAQSRSDRLDFLSNSIKDKAEDLKELSRAKRAKGKGE